MTHPPFKSSPLRIAGDKILQKAALPFPKQPVAAQAKELLRQEALARELLIDSGGAGIAANQCAEIEQPYQLIIVGIYQQNATHKVRSAKRYPGVDFPEAVVMVNPRILQQSSELISFYHGCLSVPGRLRGEWRTPRALEVEYWQVAADGSLVVAKRDFSELPAVVLQHELSHVLEGKTYFDCCLSLLSVREREVLRLALEAEMRKREVMGFMQKAEGEGFYRFVHFTEKGEVVLEEEVLKKGLGELNMDLLLGLKKQVG